MWHPQVFHHSTVIHLGAPWPHWRCWVGWHCPHPAEGWPAEWQFKDCCACLKRSYAYGKAWWTIDTIIVVSLLCAVGLIPTGQAGEPHEVPGLTKQAYAVGSYVSAAIAVPSGSTVVRLVIDRTALNNPKSELTVRLDWSPDGSDWRFLREPISKARGGNLRRPDGSTATVSSLVVSLPAGAAFVRSTMTVGQVVSVFGTTLEFD